MAIKVQNTTVIDDSRNIANAETINGITIGVKKPSIISPTDGSQTLESTITFQSSPFRTSIGPDTHVSSDWELATDSGFSNVIASSIDDTVNLTSITFSGLSLDTYFVRVRHSGATLGDSEYSDTVSFSIVSQVMYGWGSTELRTGTGSSDDDNFPVTNPTQVLGNIINWEKTNIESADGLSGKTTDGQFYVWGSNYRQGLLDGSTVDRSSPVTPAGSKNWKDLVRLNDQTFLIDETGDLYGGGAQFIDFGTSVIFQNSFVSLPNSSPAIINNIGSETWEKIISTNQINYVFITDVSGALYVWGQSQDTEPFGSLPASSTVTSPESVISNVRDWVKVAASRNYVIALRETGELYGWGSNYRFALGDTTIANASTPVSLNTGISGWLDIGTGKNTESFGLASDGQVYVWGYGEYDSKNTLPIGLSNTASPVTLSSPELIVGGITDWVSLYVTGTNYNYRSFAIRSNGELYGWGDNGANFSDNVNEYGRIGSGTTNTDMVLSPEIVLGGITGWIEIGPAFNETSGISVE